MNEQPRILYCHCAYAQTIPQGVKDRVLGELCASGLPFEATSDLCELAAHNSPALRDMLSAGPVRIVACYERAVRSLLADLAPSASALTVLNMRTAGDDLGARLLDGASNLPPSCGAPADNQPPRLIMFEGRPSKPIDPARRMEVIKALLEVGYSVTYAGAARAMLPIARQATIVLGAFDAQPDHMLACDVPVAFCDVASGTPAEIRQRVTAAWQAFGGQAVGEWIPWFPVIDAARCNSCGQCMNFCLFGVYDRADERIRVAQSAKCKTHCPACARVCPKAAIIFPKYALSPINGDEISPQPLASQGMATDLKAALSGDVYATMRARQTSAADVAKIQQALAERRKCNCSTVKPDAPPCDPGSFEPAKPQQPSHQAE